MLYEKNIKEVFAKANTEPENWIILIDEDVDVVTLYDIINNSAYYVSYKGYELTQENIIGNIQVKYVPDFETYLDEIGIE